MRASRGVIIVYETKSNGWSFLSVMIGLQGRYGRSSGRRVPRSGRSTMKDYGHALTDDGDLWNR